MTFNCCPVNLFIFSKHMSNMYHGTRLSQLSYASHCDMKCYDIVLYINQRKTKMKVILFWLVTLMVEVCSGAARASSNISCSNLIWSKIIWELRPTVKVLHAEPVSLFLRIMQSWQQQEKESGLMMLKWLVLMLCWWCVMTWVITLLWH